MPASLNAAAETDRVRRYCSPEVLRRIDGQIEHNVAYYAAQSDDVIAGRIEELKREWSLNRFLQAHSAAAGFVGSVLGLAVNRKWALITAAAFGILLAHGLRGWDPRIRPLRRIGRRTRSEIDREIYALKVARGDFKNSPQRLEGRSIPVKDILKAINA